MCRRSGCRDLRHTAASVWLGSGADPKVVQRILGHASAGMTMDLYGHLIDQNLWDAAKKLGRSRRGTKNPRARKLGPDLGVWAEPPVGIEPTTFSLRGGRSASHSPSSSASSNTNPAHSNSTMSFQEFAPRPAPRGIRHHG
ncbi:tyrosine-type recombinase/integrase [Kribbella orskensis]|uniref:tyrosine-type recombinase/integrase n=1 Tax=Kribbella TaxID=182639 RepID=UPI0034E20189